MPKDLQNTVVELDQYTEGDSVNTIKVYVARVGHIQLADNPGSYEPGTGEINFPNLFDAIDKTGYNAWIGCEYIPATDTETGLSWLEPYK